MLSIDFLPIQTPQFKMLVVQNQRLLSDEDFADFVEYLRTLHAQIRDELTGYSPGPERAKAVHRLLNRELEATQELPITCSKGCGTCCHLEVEITRDEGELLAQEILEGLNIDRARLELQAARPRKSSEWSGYAANINNRCVFLGDDGACRVYQSRPSICRKVLMVSASSQCQSAKGLLEPVEIPMAELIMSTALSLPDNPYQSLSKSVKAGLEKFEALREAGRRVSVDLDLTLDGALSESLPEGIPERERGL